MEPGAWSLEVSLETECTLNRDEHRVGLKLEFWSISLEFGVDKVYLGT